MSKPRLTVDELNAFKKQLQVLRDRLIAKVSNLEAEALRAPDQTAFEPGEEPPAHEADPANRVAEDAVAITILDSEEQVLADTVAALERIERGVFGNCEQCNHAIGRQRLEAVPYARFCITCAKQAEASSKATNSSK